MIQASATEAALAVARAHGLMVNHAEEAGTGTHVLVRLEPGGLAARVTADGPVARFAGDLDIEVRLAAALHASGAPVIPPWPGVPASARVHGGRQVTLWQWWDGGSRSKDPAAAGAGLTACHRALLNVTVSLRPWAVLDDARALLPEIPFAHRALLAAYLQPPDAPVRPVHGDAHAGNVLPGPAWHDWEDAMLACVEWDLACLVAPGGVLGGDFSYAEAVLAGYEDEYDPALLEQCVGARIANQVVTGLLLRDFFPGLPQRVEARLAWLSERAD